MFEEIANEVFKKAEVDPAKEPELYRQCVDILSTAMARLSATMGMSLKRVEAFEAQKQSLVEDLKGMRASGEIVNR